MNVSLRTIFRITGTTLMVTGLSMLPSVFISFIYDEQSVYIPFLLTMLGSFFIGLVLRNLFYAKPQQLKVRDGFLIVTLFWFLVSILGAVPFMVTGSITGFTDAFFESCSGFSTTGASILTDVEALPKGILFWRSFTQWMGGLGILIISIALMPSLGISGQNITASDTPSPTIGKVTLKTSDTTRMLYTIYLLLTVIEVLLLMAGGMGLYDALIHSFGTVSTGGFSNYNASIAYFNSTYIKVIITAFMVISGVNFNLLYLSFRRGPKIFFEDSEFKLYALLITVISIFIITVLIFSGTYTSAGDAAADSVFQVASILTTTGYASADYQTWPQVCQMLILLLMFMGGCSSSTSGGLKIVRILVLLKLIRRGISTRLHPNVISTIKLNGKTMPNDTVSAVASHTFLYIVLVFVGAFVIAFENADLMTCFSSVITCLGNIGPGFGFIGPENNFSAMSGLSKYLLSFYMIAGRLELYTLFILLNPKFWNPNN